MIIFEPMKLIRAYEEADTAPYICSCGYEKDVAEEYDREARMFFPVQNTCPVCGETMEKKTIKEAIPCLTI